MIAIHCIRKSTLLRTLIHKKRDSVGYPFRCLCLSTSIEVQLKRIIVFEALHFFRDGCTCFYLTIVISKINNGNIKLWIYKILRNRNHIFRNFRAIYRQRNYDGVVISIIIYIINSNKLRGRIVVQYYRTAASSCLVWCNRGIYISDSCSNNVFVFV